MAMTVELPALEGTHDESPASRPPFARLRRFARPALGLLLPVGLALGWEIVVWLGLSSGGLVPPPSKLFATIMELAESGELTQHVMATLRRVGGGFGIGVGAGTLLRGGAGCFGLERAPPRVTGFGRADCSTPRCRRGARSPRSPGCRCSSCGSAFSKLRR